ncbi:TPA: queuosine precursor transporter, partial [Legionella pneumophila]|nr:queuosine precursor transporter [Legionella pneumophila]
MIFIRIRLKGLYILKNNLSHLPKGPSNLTASVINNPLGYQYLAFLSMIYICMMLFNAILTNRYIGTDYIFVLGGTFTSPFVFLIDNIIAEIYGFKITRSIILFGIFSQTIFVLLCQLVLQAPYPQFFQNNNSYEIILGWSLFRIHISGCAAYLLAILFNTKILTQWKVLLKGKKFWLRSLGTCTISELLYSFIAILLMEIQSIPFTYIFKIVILSYTI